MTFDFAHLIVSNVNVAIREDFITFAVSLVLCPAALIAPAITVHANPQPFSFV
jgi:hypothetical protein